MIKTAVLALCVALNLLPILSYGQDSSFVRKKYITQRTLSAISIDGVPNEEAWSAVHHLVAIIHNGNQMMGKNLLNLLSLKYCTMTNICMWHTGHMRILQTL